MKEITAAFLGFCWGVILTFLEIGLYFHNKNTPTLILPVLIFGMGTCFYLMDNFY